MNKDDIKQKIVDAYSALYGVSADSVAYATQITKINALIVALNTLPDTTAPSS